MDHAADDDTMSEGSSESYVTSGSGTSSSDDDDDYLCSFCGQPFERASNLNLHICVAPVDRNIISTYSPMTATSSNQPTTSALDSAFASAADSYSNQASASASATAEDDSSQAAGGSNVGHQSTQTVQGEHWCNVCGQGFPDPNVLSDHRREHMSGVSAPGAATPFRCTLCLAQFPLRKMLVHHLLYRHKMSQLDCLRNAKKLWFRPIGRRQMRLGGARRRSELNGIYVIFEGLMMGETTDNLPIGPVRTRVVHNVNREDFNEREFWENARTQLSPMYNNLPGITMNVTNESPDSTDPNNNNVPPHQ